MEVRNYQQVELLNANRLLLRTDLCLLSGFNLYGVVFHSFTLDMVQLHFTLSPESTSKLHDTLSCLSRFSDSVAIEAQRETVSNS